MTTIETYLQKAIEADVSYGDLDKNMSATNYMRELTRTDSDGEIKLTTEQAKAFAGVTEQKDKNGNIIKDENGNIQYEFITKKVQQDDGTTKEVRIKGYKVIETYNDPNTGYSGTLLKNIETGELILSNRGTELKSIEDLGDDVTLTRGQVPEQFISLSNFMKKLIDEHDGVIDKNDSVYSMLSLGICIKNVTVRNTPNNNIKTLKSNFNIINKKDTINKRDYILKEVA